MNFEQYKRTSIVEVRKVTQEEINTFHNNVDKSIHDMNEFFYNRNFIEQQVLSLTDKQIELGCPKLGDVIVRNIKDSWDISYVSEEEFNNTFTKYKEANKNGYTLMYEDASKILTKRCLRFGFDFKKVHIYKTIFGAERMRDCLQPNTRIPIKIVIVKDGIVEINNIIS